MSILPARIISSCLPRKTSKPIRVHLRGEGNRQALCGTAPGINTRWMDVASAPDCTFCIQSLETRTKAANAKPGTPRASERPGLDDSKKIAFGHRLDVRMVAIDKTPADLMEATEASRRTVNGWIAGRAIPHGSSLKALAAYLGVTADWLVNGEAAVDKRRLSDLPGLYRVTRVSGAWQWTSPPLAGTKAGLEKFFAYPGAKTNATLIGAL